MNPFPDVHRIGVLRGGGLGDLVQAMPAMAALRAAYPDAELVLLGSPVHADLLRDRPGPVDAVIALPDAHGFAGHGTVAEFAERAGHFDLGVQVDGDGQEANPLLLSLHPALTVGSRTGEAPCLTRSLPFRHHQHEVLRALEVVALAGAEAVSFEPRLTVTDDDLAEARSALGPVDRPLLVLHPGAADPRHRWQPERFAGVAAALAGTADTVVIGTAAEAALADAVVRAAGPSARSLAGGLSVRGLVGVLAVARVLVANDDPGGDGSGTRHLAQAVGTPTISVRWTGAAPLSGLDHRVHLSLTSRCPVCGAECASPGQHHCAHGFSHVGDIEPADVVADALGFLADGAPAR